MGSKKKSSKDRKLSPIPYRDLINVFKQCGYEISRETSHVILRCKGKPLTLAIPKKGKGVKSPVIRTLIRKAGLTKEQYFEILDKL